MKNKHYGMELHSLFFKQGEFNNLVSAIECNEKEKSFVILAEMMKRGDLVHD